MCFEINLLSDVIFIDRLWILSVLLLVVYYIRGVGF